MATSRLTALRGYQIFDGTTVGNVFITGAGAEPPPPAPGPCTIFIGFKVTVTDGNVHILKSSANNIIVAEVTLLKGTIKVEDNLVSNALLINENQVTQNLQVYKNQGGNAKQVTANVVGANLQCFDSGPPFVGGPNAATKAEGDCF